MNKSLFSTFSAVVVGLALLPGCEQATKEAEERPSETAAVQVQEQAALAVSGPQGSEHVLMTINGRPAVTVSGLEQYKNDIIDAQPEQNREQYRQIMTMVPGALKSIFDSQVNEEIIDEWVKTKGIDKTAAYQKEEQENLERFKKFNRRSLNVKKFQESVPVTVSATEIRKYYDENKDKIGDLMLCAGGVTTKAVMFTKEDEAKAFLDSIKAGGDFDKVAQDQKLTVKDLGPVNEQCYEVDAPIRTKVTTITKFPTTELIKIGDNSFAVIRATGKEETKYVPFEQVQGPLEQYLKQQKSTEVLLKELEALKKEFKVTINEDYFKAQQPAAMPQEASAMPQREGSVAPQPATAAPRNI